MADTSQVEVPPHTNGISEEVDDEERAKMRPADIDADVKEMERRKRVELIMNSKLFRDELERIIEVQLRDGSGTSGLMQQISDMMGVSKNAGNVFKNSNCVVPINDIRGIEAMGYAKGEKILRCKLAAVYRLIDLYGWTQGTSTLITARLNQDEEHFLVNPYGMLFHEITASSLIKADMQGNVVEQGTTNFGVNLSAYSLHAAIHSSRPDIKCIIHVHTPSVVAVSALKCGLLPISQESVVIGEVSTHPYIGGVSDPEEKDKITRNLGPNNKVLLLTNQGAVCCGETIEEAFFNARNTVLASESQLKLMPMGIDNLILLNDETRKKLYEAAHKAPESSPRPDQPSILEAKIERKWRVGGVEFEALMRMLDNAGFRTGYIYRHPLVKGDPPRPRSDVEVPPAVSSLGYLLEEEELYKQGLWKKLEGGRKGNDRTRWLNSPNVYQKVEILETGTPDPKKITKWVADGSPTHSSTPVKIENALQFVPKNTNPKEFKKLQQQIKDYRRADKISAGPQSHILEGVTWEEARKMQDAGVTQTGDQVVLMGAASKGIIQRGFQHNATMYKSPYAKNPFDSITDEEIDEYKKVVEKKTKGEYDTDFSESEGLSSAQINKRISDIRSPTSAASETEEESRDEPQVLRIETKQAPKPSQPEVVLSDVMMHSTEVVLDDEVFLEALADTNTPPDVATRNLLMAERKSATNSMRRRNVVKLVAQVHGAKSPSYRTNSFAGFPSGSYAVPNPKHFHIARCTRATQHLRPTLIRFTDSSHFTNNQQGATCDNVTINVGNRSYCVDVSMEILRAFIFPFANTLNLLAGNVNSSASQTCYNMVATEISPINLTNRSVTPLVSESSGEDLETEMGSFERKIMQKLHNNLVDDLMVSNQEYETSVNGSNNVSSTVSSYEYHELPETCNFSEESNTSLEVLNNSNTFGISDKGDRKHLLEEVKTDERTHLYQSIGNDNEVSEIACEQNKAKEETDKQQGNTYNVQTQQQHFEIQQTDTNYSIEEQPATINDTQQINEIKNKLTDKKQKTGEVIVEEQQVETFLEKEILNKLSLNNKFNYSHRKLEEDCLKMKESLVQFVENQEAASKSSLSEDNGQTDEEEVTKYDVRIPDEQSKNLQYIRNQNLKANLCFEVEKGVVTIGHVQAASEDQTKQSVTLQKTEEVISIDNESKTFSKAQDANEDHSIITVVQKVELSTPEIACDLLQKENLCFEVEKGVVTIGHVQAASEDQTKQSVTVQKTERVISTDNESKTFFKAQDASDDHSIITIVQKVELPTSEIICDLMFQNYSEELKEDNLIESEEKCFETSESHEQTSTLTHISSTDQYFDALEVQNSREDVDSINEEKYCTGKNQSRNTLITEVRSSLEYEKLQDGISFTSSRKLNQSNENEIINQNERANSDWMNKLTPHVSKSSEQPYENATITVTNASQHLEDIPATSFHNGHNQTIENNIIDKNLILQSENSDSISQLTPDIMHTKKTTGNFNEQGEINSSFITANESFEYLVMLETSDILIDNGKKKIEATTTECTESITHKHPEIMDSNDVHRNNSAVGVKVKENHKLDNTRAFFETRQEDSIQQKRGVDVERDFGEEQKMQDFKSISEADGKFKTIKRIEKEDSIEYQENGKLVTSNNNKSSNMSVNNLGIVEETAETDIEESCRTAEDLIARNRESDEHNLKLTKGNIYDLKVETIPKKQEDINVGGEISKISPQSRAKNKNTRKKGKGKSNTSDRIASVIDDQELNSQSKTYQTIDESCKSLEIPESTESFHSTENIEINKFDGPCELKETKECTYQPKTAECIGELIKNSVESIEVYDEKIVFNNTIGIEVSNETIVDSRKNVEISGENKPTQIIECNVSETIEDCNETINNSFEMETEIGKPTEVVGELVVNESSSENEGETLQDCVAIIASNESYDVKTNEIIENPQVTPEASTEPNRKDSIIGSIQSDFFDINEAIGDRSQIQSNSEKETQEHMAKIGHDKNSEITVNINDDVGKTATQEKSMEAIEQKLEDIQIELAMTNEFVVLEDEEKPHVTGDVDEILVVFETDFNSFPSSTQEENENVMECDRKNTVTYTFNIHNEKLIDEQLKTHEDMNIALDKESDVTGKFEMVKSTDCNANLIVKTVESNLKDYLTESTNLQKNTACTEPNQSKVEIRIEQDTLLSPQLKGDTDVSEQTEDKHFDVDMEQEMVDLITKYIVKNCLELSDAVIFPEIERDENFTDLTKKLVHLYAEYFFNSCTDDEIKTELRLSLQNKVLTTLNINQHENEVSDRSFVVTEFLCDLLDHVFNLFEHTRFDEFEKELRDDNMHSTPEKGKQSLSTGKKNGVLDSERNREKLMVNVKKITGIDGSNNQSLVCEGNIYLEREGSNNFSSGTNTVFKEKKSSHCEESEDSSSDEDMQEAYLEYQKILLGEDNGKKDGTSMFACGLSKDSMCKLGRFKSRKFKLIKKIENERRNREMYERTLKTHEIHEINDNENFAPHKLAGNASIERGINNEKECFLKVEECLKQGGVLEFSLNQRKDDKFSNNANQPVTKSKNEGRFKLVHESLFQGESVDDNVTPENVMKIRKRFEELEHATPEQSEPIGGNTKVAGSHDVYTLMKRYEDLEASKRVVAEKSSQSEDKSDCSQRMSIGENVKGKKFREVTFPHSLTCECTKLKPCTDDDDVRFSIEEYEEDLTSFQMKRMRSGSEFYWLSITKSPKQPTPKKAAVINVDDIPLRPPPDLNLTFDVSADDQCLPPILEEAKRRLSFDEDDDLTPLDNNDNKHSHISDRRMVCEDNHEVNRVVHNEVKFFRSNTSNSNGYAQKENVSFNKNTDASEKDGNWMGYKSAKF